MPQRKRKRLSKAERAEARAILDVVGRYAEGHREGDGDILREVFSPWALVSGYEGKEAHVAEPFTTLCDYANQHPAPAFQHRIRRGPVPPFRLTATVSIEEQNYEGYNYTTELQLMKTDNRGHTKPQWWIVSALYRGTKA
jgi:hypothetical protein